jgi:glycerate 2-kinase
MVRVPHATNPHGLNRPDPRSIRVLVAPDKFKGSLTAAEVAACLARGLRSAGPRLDVREIPVADGGDGTVDACVAAGYTRRTAQVAGPTGEQVEAAYALRGDTAVLELAEASGLRRLPGAAPDPLGAHTRGVGDLIKAALDDGAATIILGLGGSASTDGGAGMLRALGARFLDERGEEIPDGGGALGALRSADLSGLDPRCAGAAFLVATDVDNPLLGAQGAAAVYGPQKGATEADVVVLERGLQQFGRVLSGDGTTAGTAGARAARAAQAAELPGAGAAGGVGYAALAVLGAQRRPGIDMVLTAIGFAGALDGVQVVITGEGRLDAQTLRGKAPAGVAEAARARGIRVLAVCGRVELTARQAAAAGFARTYALTDIEPDPVRAMRDAAGLLVGVGERIGRGLILPRVRGDSRGGRCSGRCGGRSWLSVRWLRSSGD